VVIVLMIEKKGAVENLEEILSLGEIDMLQWGPGDYSMSIGQPGTWPTPELREIERQVIETGLKMGVQPRAEIRSPEQAKYYLDLGVRHFCMGADIAILYSWLQENGESLRKVVEGA
jgi:4-hydroxy-2-oxoheptanedioate aldolase